MIIDPWKNAREYYKAYLADEKNMLSNYPNLTPHRPASVDYLDKILIDADALLTMVPVLQKLAEVDEEDGALANVLLFNDEARIPKQIIIAILDTFAFLPERLKG